MSQSAEAGIKRKKMRKTDKQLTPQQYEVLRNKGTEPPFTGKYHDSKESGMYRCAGCGQELFSSAAKFDSGTGWPSFTDPVAKENIELKPDDSHGMRRLEVICKKCGGHLGHVFDDGPAENKKRYCINSCALDLERQKK